MINAQSVDRLAAHIADDAPFDRTRFIRQAKQGLDEMELKERGIHLATVLNECFECDYPDATTWITADFEGTENSENVTSGMSLWAFLAFIELFGVEHYDASMAAIKTMTAHFSGEFAIRPFIERYKEKTLAQLAEWAHDPSEHVRRLVSEGSRPLLPWGKRLHAIKENPHLTLPLLETLKDDPSEYVRRSVSNHLNDFSKNHPELVVEIAEQWWSDDPTRQKTVRHALRTLLKKGDPKALAVLGFAKPKVSGSLSVETPKVSLGGMLKFAVSLDAKANQKWMIDYAVHHVKANGRTTAKVFKWTTRTVDKGDSLTLERNHVMKPISTRRYYSGTHAVEVFVNGVSVGRESFEFDAD